MIYYHSSWFGGVGWGGGVGRGVFLFKPFKMTEIHFVIVVVPVMSLMLKPWVLDVFAAADFCPVWCESSKWGEWVSILIHGLENAVTHHAAVFQVTQQEIHRHSWSQHRNECVLLIFTIKKAALDSGVPGVGGDKRVQQRGGQLGSAEVLGAELLLKLCQHTVISPKRYGSLLSSSKFAKWKQRSSSRREQNTGS